MTEETCSIARLDRSQPPLGYVVEHDGPDGRWCWELVGVGGGYANGRDAALAAAWAHFEAASDPPGMHVRPWGFHGWVVAFSLALESSPGPRVALFDDDKEPFKSEVDARAAAWAWYWQRVKLADALATITVPSSAGVRAPFWPRCLTWSDEQVVEVERWIDGGSTLPSALAGGAA